MIIRTNKDLRYHLGGVIDMALTSAEGEEENNRILAYVPVAENKFIIKAIGKDTFEYLESKINDAEASNADKALLKLIQKATAFYTYAEYASYSVGTEGASGFKVDEKNSVKMWQVLERMDKSYDIGASTLESALNLLFTGDYSIFKESEIWLNTYKLLVNSGSVLHRALPASGGSYRIFITLWPYLADAEPRECSLIMGNTLYNSLLTKKHSNPAVLNDKEKQVLAIAQKLAAHSAYLSALNEVFVVEVDGGSLRVKSEFDGIRNKNTPTEKQLFELSTSIQSKINTYRNELKTFLDANVGYFPEYKAERFKGRSKLGLLDNDKYTTIFSLR